MLVVLSRAAGGKSPASRSLLAGGVRVRSRVADWLPDGRRARALTPPLGGR